MLSLLIALCFACSPVEAAPRLEAASGEHANPDAKKPTSALDYLDRCFEIHQRYADRIEELIDRPGSFATLAEYEAFRTEIRREILGLRAELAELPTWEGDNSLRDDDVQNNDNTIALLDGPVHSVAVIVYQEQVRSADMDTLEALFASIDQTLMTISAKEDRAAAAFGERHHIRITMIDPPDERPEFEHPGLAPAGSHVSARLYAVMASKYQGGLHRSQEVSTQAMQDLILAANQGTVEDLDRQLALVEAELAVVEAAGPWLGDAALQVTVADGLRQAVELGQQHVRPMIELRSSKVDTQAEVDLYNQHVSGANEAVSAFNHRLVAAVGEFEQRWGIAALRAWETAADAAKAEAAATAEGRGVDAPVTRSTPKEGPAP